MWTGVKTTNEILLCGLVLKTPNEILPFRLVLINPLGIFVTPVSHGMSRDGTLPFHWLVFIMANKKLCTCPNWLQCKSGRPSVNISLAGGGIVQRI